MMNSLPTWLVVIQVAIVAEAQHFGMFVYKTPDNSFTYEVNKNYEVTFGVNVTVELSQWRPDAKSKSFHYGPYPLKRVTSRNFTVDFDGHKHSLRDWYTSIEKAVADGDAANRDGEYPPIGMNLGDLTVLQYDGPDILSAHFLGRKISFRRVTRSLKTGKFVHNGCMKPSLRLSFRVYNSGVVGIKAICGVQQRTRRVHFKLVRRNADNYRWFGVGPYRHDYQYYDVKTAEEGTLDEFRQEMRSACRPRYVSPTALSYVTFVTDDVIRVRLGETDVVLVKQ